MARKVFVDEIQNHAGGLIKGSDAWELLQTQVASASATIDVIDVITSDYFLYKFFWYAIKPTTDSRDLFMRTSTDNGGAWDGAASDYAWCTHRIAFEDQSTAVVGDDADSEIELIPLAGSATNETSDLEVTLFNPSGTEFTKFKWELLYTNVQAEYRHLVGAGMRLSAADVTGVRFLFESGSTIASGTLKVYGLRA